MLAAACVFGADRATKWLVLGNLVPGERIELTSFLNLVLVYNRGVSFGLLSELGALAPWALVLLTVAVALLLLLWLWREPRRASRLAIWAILGGAAGNLFDRLAYGAVVDFLDFHLGRYHWPAFNFADMAVVCGAALLLFDSFFARPAVADAGKEGRP